MRGRSKTCLNLFITVCVIGIATSAQPVFSAGPDYRPAGPAANWQSYEIRRAGGFSTSVSVAFGGYQTTQFGVYSKFKSAKEPIRSAGRTRYANSKLLYAFDIVSPYGPTVHVQVGHKATGKMRGIGRFKKEANGPLTGSMTRGNSFVGRFEVVPPKHVLGIRKEPKVGERILQGKIITPQGTLQTYRTTASRQNKSKLQKFLHGSHVVVDEYQLNGKIVAARGRVPRQETMWFQKTLPHDLRLCILADAALRVFDDIRDNDLANTNATTNSTIRLLR